MRSYYVVHNAGHSLYQVDAFTLADVYLWCNYRFGRVHAGNANAIRKNAEPQPTYKVYDDKREAQKLFPKARFSGLAEIPYGAGRTELREFAGLGL